jgi:hypothetical protein
MLSPLKPLLCRHDFYWSERHRSDRCRRCGKLQAAATVEVLAGEPVVLADGGALMRDAAPALAPAERVFIDFAEASRPPAARSPATIRPSAKVLRAQARERRDMLPVLLDRLVEGVRPTREEAIDALLAVIEDAHSADPVLFGAEAAAHFARLHEARSAPRC